MEKQTKKPKKTTPKSDIRTVCGRNDCYIVETKDAIECTTCGRIIA